MWDQIYDPLHSKVLSTIAAAIPVVTLLILIATNKVKAHIAAIIALIVANLVAILIFTMPAGLSIRASILGAVTGFFPIGWIVLNVIFMYQLTLATGRFEALKRAGDWPAPQTYLFTGFLPMLRERGVSDAQIAHMLEENPRRFFAGAPFKI